MSAPFPHATTNPQLLLHQSMGGHCSGFLPKTTLDVCNDIVELLVGLALAVAHGELTVNQRAVCRDLKSTGATRVLGLGELDLVAELLLEEAGERGGEADVASSASELDVHGQGRHCVLTGKRMAAAPARGLHPTSQGGRTSEHRVKKRCRNCCRRTGQRRCRLPSRSPPSQLPSSLFLAV